MNSVSVPTKIDPQGVSHNPPATITHLPGIIALNTKLTASCELRSWGRTMALFKEDGQEMYQVDHFHDESNRKKHFKFIRKNARYLKDIFNENEGLWGHTSGDYKILIPLSGEAYNMVCAEVRSEVYVPIAVFHKNKLRGGVYAYVWRCCSAEQAQANQPRPIANAPVTAIVTGMCMFGTNIVGVDQNGKKHPLTNTFYTFPDGVCIERIEVTRDGLHPYEQMMLREFDLQLPMIKALGNGLSQKIFYQCAHAEYMIYGINAYILGKMSLRALHVYARYVSERTNLIRDAIEKYCQRHGFDFDDGQSTLSCLFDETKIGMPPDTERWLINFIYAQDIQPNEIEKNIPMTKRLEIVREVLIKCVNKLASQPGIHGDVWQNIKQKAILSSDGESTEVNASSLLTLNFLNYAAKVAIVKGSNPEMNLCLLHPFQEKAMALAYKDLHADKFGEILAINWIPPIFSHGSFKDGLYYLDEHKDAINHLIHEGLLEFCALETGAEAIGDTITAHLAKSHVMDLLGEVGKYMPTTPSKEENNTSHEYKKYKKDVSHDHISKIF